MRGYQCQHLKHFISIYLYTLYVVRVILNMFVQNDNHSNWSIVRMSAVAQQHTTINNNKYWNARSCELEKRKRNEQAIKRSKNNNTIVMEMIHEYYYYWIKRAVGSLCYACDIRSHLMKEKKSQCINSRTSNRNRWRVVEFKILIEKSSFVALLYIRFYIWYTEIVVIQY